LPAVRFKVTVKDFKQSRPPSLGDFVLGVHAPGRTISYGTQTATDYLRCCVWLGGWFSTLNELKLEPGGGEVEFEFVSIAGETLESIRAGIDHGIVAVVSRETEDEWYLGGYGPMILPSAPGEAIKGDPSSV